MTSAIRTRRSSPPRRVAATAALATSIVSLAALWSPSAAVAAPLSEKDSREALAALSGSSAKAAQIAVDRVLAERDERFVAVFIELIHGGQVGLASPRAQDVAASALLELTGRRFGTDWPAWARWYAATDLSPPPGFTAWKGALLGNVDPRFAEILTEGAASRIRVEEVVWGGVPFEGIPVLERPAVVSASEATYLDAGEPVFGVVFGGRARAYPQSILDWHEMTNDTVGGIAFSLAYCTLCGSGIAYRARASDGREYDFGSSGLLLRSNKLMVDRQTRTLWNHLTGRPVLGPLASTDVFLERLPLVVTRWSDWKSRHPETTVLSLATGHRRTYSPGAAYSGYFASSDTMFPVRRPRGALEPKDRVFAVELDGRHKAYPLGRILSQRVVQDRIASRPLVLVTGATEIRVEGESLRRGPARYLAGAPVRAYASGSHRFTLASEGALRDANGALWRVDEEALVGPGGERLARVPGYLSYWFGWRSFHPMAPVYGEDDGSGPPGGSGERAR